MINLQQLSDRYKKEGIGVIRFGRHSYYEINSEIPLKLNSYGGTQGFILDEQNRVELFDIDKKQLVKRHYYTDEEWEVETSEITEQFWDETSSTKWWGLTLDKYFPHPWFPDKEIIAFQIMNDIPGARKDKILAVVDEYVKVDILDGEIFYATESCLHFPEFFKPLYK